MSEQIEKDAQVQVDSQEKVESKDFSCPQCAAPIQYDPETSTLKCEYCGFTQVLDGKESTDEYDFTNVEESEANSWRSETKIIRCDNCGAENVVANNDITSTCPFCGSNQVVETKELAGIKPHRVIPFKINKENAQRIYIKWLKKKFFTPSKIKKGQVKVGINGVYLPVWTFDTDTYSVYKGRIGKYYTRRVGSGKNARTVTEIRWRNIAGTRQVAFDDIIVNAGEQVKQEEVNSLSPFNTNDAFIYEANFLAGFSAEHYKVKLSEGWVKAKTLAKPVIQRSILSQYNYDTVGYLDITTNYNNIKYKYVLIPTWIGVYDYNTKHYRFIVNGETGKLCGKAPVSPLKVTMTVLVLVILLGIVVFVLYYTGVFE